MSSLSALHHVPLASVTLCGAIPLLSVTVAALLPELGSLEPLCLYVNFRVVL